MAEPGEAAPVARGAEASIRRVDWLGFAAVLKERDPKSYRPKALDERLRRERTRNEARLLADARRAGVRTPLVYDVDLAKGRLILEEVEGPTLRALLEGSATDATPLLPSVRQFGEALGRLHAAGISHGDLTSSNVLFPSGPEGRPAFLDLSMGAKAAGLEELGIDLHLVEEDLKALHPKGERLFEEFLRGYAAGFPQGHLEVERRAKAIRGRVRYA